LELSLEEMKRRANKRSNNKLTPKPIAPPPMKSRKKARKVTTLFHKLTQCRDEALKLNDISKVQEFNTQISEMGGFDEYQRASQLNTRLHSTSRWVLKFLLDKGLLYSGGSSSVGMEDKEDDDHDDTSTNTVIHDPTVGNNTSTKQCLRVLEIGAINTELLEATQKYHPLHVRAIDLHSTHPDIEQVDFLTMSSVVDSSSSSLGSYNVIVCSMVLNYVSTPTDRGLMLRLIYQQLQPQGLCFLTLPKLCLDQSPYITKQLFEDILVNQVGFIMEEKRDSPKIYFWILQRPMDSNIITRTTRVDPSSSPPAAAAVTMNMRKGHKYRNNFQVVL
jgi:25S rRNA (adenine2142-N1)-methyltransferase